MQDQFEAFWRESAEKDESIRYTRDQTFEGILRSGRSLIRTYRESFPVSFYSIVAIEEPFACQPEGLDIPIIGVMDLVEEDENGTLIITENKTSKKAYSDSQIDTNLQLTTYQVAARSNGYQARDIVLRIDCLIKTAVPKFQQYYTTRSPLDEHRTIRKIRKVWEAIQRGVFVPNDTSWKCPYCEYRFACDQWFKEGYGGGDDQ
jgi:putative RecB family exonuclease